MNLVRLPGFTNESVPEVKRKQIKQSFAMFSMGAQEIESLVLKRTLNAIWVACRRGQNETRVNILVDHSTRASDQSGVGVLALEACHNVESCVRQWGFRIYHVVELLTDKKGCVVRASDGRVIKTLYLKVENLQHVCVNSINNVHARWVALNKETPKDRKVRSSWKRKK